MEIIVDDLSSTEIILLLEEHLSDMYATSPQECVHALDLHALRSSEITFFSTWINSKLAACIAIKRLSKTEAELKSMRTVQAFKGKGVASKQLEHVLTFAREQGYKSISLETGTQDYFKPARNLYKKFGFTDCEPFSSYLLNPNSHFMTRCV